MATPSARFVIGFDADTSGIDQSKSKLDSLKATIDKDTKALTEMKAAMERLKGTAEVARFQALPKDIAKAESEVEKLSNKMTKLKSDFAKAPADKKEGIFAEGLKTQGALDAATKRVSALKAEQEKLGKTEPVKLFNDLKAASDKTKQSLGQTQTQFSRLGGTVGKVKNSASNMEHLSEAAQQLPGPLGNIASKFEQIKKMGTAGAIVAIAVAAIGLAVAFTSIIGKALAFGLAMSDAARSAALIRDANAVGSASAAELKIATQGVLDKTNAQEDAVASLVAEYSRLRLTMNGIEAATNAVTMATQTAGAAAGSTIKGLIDRGINTKRFWLNALDLKGTGLALRDVSSQLAKQMGIAVGAAEAALRDGRVKLEDGIKALDAAVEARFGEVARRQMLALPTQLERLKKNLSSVFSGIKIEAFLERLNDALSLFKETEVVGKALKQIFSVVLQPFIDSATTGMPLVEGFIYGVVVALQALTILGLKTAIVIKKMWGSSDTLKNVDMLKAGIYAGAAAVSVFVGVMTALAAATVVVVVGLALLLAVVALIASPIFAIGYGIGYVVDEVSTAIDDLVEYMNDTGTSIGDAVKGILKAIVDGIGDGIVDVADAFKGLAEAGIKAFKDAIQMKSPPRVFVGIGEAIPDATAQGIEQRTPAVASALSNMADPSDVGSQQAAQGLLARTTTAASDGAKYVLNYYGSGSRSDARQFAQWLNDEIELARLASGQPA